jgi:asparagine synthase (glutamine-hydrolysing)
VSGPAPLTDFEIATGDIVGADPGSPPLPPYDGRSPRAALEDALLPALARDPCVVTFSGGRDSSAMLAVATHVARREGLPLPVPMTLRYPDNPDSEESDWQQLVIDHLGLRNWELVEIQDEHDLVGPLAARALRAHGVLFPPNTHSHMSMMERAHGGAIVTGIDGDGLLGDWIYDNVAGVLSWRRRPELRDAARLALHAAPPAVRAAVIRRRLRRPYTWLRPDALHRTRALVAAEMVAEPRSWRARIPWWRARRYLALDVHGYEQVSADYGVLPVHPFLDPVFLSALAHEGGRLGAGDRSDVMRLLFGDLLPELVIVRGDKATFDTSFWHDHSREFARNWDGTGVDPAIVDVDRLHALWQRDVPPPGTAMLLQAAWLATQR